ncbi:hypothetical protein BaRGS_00012579 [Batillaria attramentaria]|uniref:Uncharacterized protein n=1 Tax=Batillaria attramentaria TaxID=370345 RepID=A0ABD0L9E0_9CAEN
MVRCAATRHNLVTRQPQSLNMQACDHVIHNLNRATAPFPSPPPSPSAPPHPRCPLPIPHFPFPSSPHDLLSSAHCHRRIRENVEVGWDGVDSRIWCL